MKNYMEQETKSLYREQFEHDNCGIGAVVNSKGIKSHKTVENALKIVENLEHRAGKDAEGKTGDGVGIMLQISHKFFQKVTKPLGIELGEAREYGVGMFFFPHRFVDTLEMSRKIHPEKPSHKVAVLIRDYGIGDVEEHRALSDATQENMLYEAMRREEFGR